MSAIREGASVRLRGAYRYGEAPGELLHAGAEGLVVDLLGGGRGLAVEFTVRKPAFGPGGEIFDYGKFALGYLRADQVEQVS